MRKTMMAIAGLGSLALLAAPAAATEEDPGVPGHVSVSAEQTECGKVKVVLHNDTGHHFGAIWSAPGATEQKGSFTDSAVIEFPEDANGGESHVAVVISEGAEQADYLKPGGTPVVLGGSWDDTLPSARAYTKVDTDCEEAPPTTDPTTPPNDDDDGDDGGDPGNGGDDGDRGNEGKGGDGGSGGDGAQHANLPGDRANDDGTAPTPTPQKGHLSVTG